MLGESQQMQRIADGSERVSQFVGERRQEFVFSPIGGLQRRFRLLLSGDIARDFRRRDDPPRSVANGRNAQRDVNQLSVFGNPHGGKMLNVLATAKLLDDAG